MLGEAMEGTVEKLNEVLESYWEATLEYLPRVGIALLVFLLGLLIGSLLVRWIKGRLQAHSNDRIMASVLSRGVRILVYFAVFLLTLHAAGLTGVAAGLFGALGASTLILGFAFKDIGENFIAGIILAFSRPFNVGDTIEVDGYFGKIKGLAFRYTQVKTFDGKDVYVPNASVLTNAVINYTEDGYIRQEFVVGIAYEDDIDAAIKLVDRVVAEYPNIINDDAHPSFSCVDELAASTVNIKVRFWLETVNYRREALEARGAFMRAVKEQLDDNGFGLPADITELKLYNGERSIPIEIVHKSADEVEDIISEPA